jgi:3-hexulose-6-phosphate synthase
MLKTKKARTLEVTKLGAHIIGVHTGLDQQAAGQTPFGDLGMVTSLNTGAKVSVAGGIKAGTVRQVVDAGADIVVAGAAIYGAADPAAAATEITALARSNGATAASGNKWLPWVLALAAIAIVFSLLGGNKSADPVAEGTPAVEEMATEEAAPAVEEMATEAAPMVEEMAAEAQDTATDLVGAAKEAASAE